MKLIWLTDLHLDLAGRLTSEELCTTIRQHQADAILITGDIATSGNVCRYLTFIDDHIAIPIYFVLGNHDYYNSSIKSVSAQVSRLCTVNTNLIWLSQSGVIELNTATCLIGHEGFADGRLGDPLGSRVELNDYYYIEELRQPTKELRLQVQNRLGDMAAAHLKSCLRTAIGTYERILVGLHVPPFPEVCWHQGRNTDGEFLPHFGCQATGDVLRTAMMAHPEISMEVFCGHTHSAGYAEILPNLKVHTAGAEYGLPRIADIIPI